MRRTASARLAVLVLSLGISAPCLAKTYTVTVTAGDHDARDVPITVVVDEPAGPLASNLTLNRDRIPSQVHRAGDRTEVSWIIPELNKGTKLRYSLQVRPGAAADSSELARGVSVKED